MAKQDENILAEDQVGPAFRRERVNAEMSPPEVPGDIDPIEAEVERSLTQLGSDLRDRVDTAVQTAIGDRMAELEQAPAGSSRFHVEGAIFGAATVLFGVIVGAWAGKR